MASIDTAIYTRLSTFAGLTSLVSTRIYPPLAPQNATYPLITYFQVDGIRDYVMSNQSGIVDARFQIDIYATTPSGARAVAEQVRLALSNYHGTSDTIVINFCMIDNEQRMPPEDEGDLQRISQDYIISWFEAVP